MSGAGRTTSIARRIAWRFQWRKLWRILFQTAVLFCGAVAVWCIAAETILCGGLTGWEGRRIVLHGFGEAWRPLSHVIGAAFRQEDWFAGTAVYQVGGASADMGPFLFWLFLLTGGLTVLRLIGWLLSCLRATERIRRYLRPIDDIAQATESISSRGFDESKFHSLEEAIDHLNGASPDEQLHVGDSDLAGLETAVNNLIARMHASYRRQVQFVDDASHELRTPIAVIQGYADMLARWGTADEKVLTESIQAIRTEAAHMKTLVEQLLFLARGDAGRQRLDLRPMDLAALAREIWEESRLIDPGREYVLDAPAPVPVRGDGALLKQAVRILADNARKYSPADGRITLRAMAEDGAACVQVQDNGAGIAPADAPHVFDRFYRADSARTTEGAGLGLAIARWIVARHGGSIRLWSYEGVGTRMTVCLPPPGPER